MQKALYWYPNLETISQDRGAAYKRLPTDFPFFPDVWVITDRFHVVRQFTCAFSRTRIALEEVVNMFDHPYSNGSIERTNRTIK